MNTKQMSRILREIASTNGTNELPIVVDKALNDAADYIEGMDNAKSTPIDSAFHCDNVRVENNPSTGSPDPWKHRSKGMKCATCMWFVEKKTTVVQTCDHFIGRCRRHAPTMNGYPVVYSDDWCGDHKLDETKI